jgi:hypothetical protein
MKIQKQSWTLNFERNLIELDNFDSSHWFPFMIRVQITGLNIRDVTEIDAIILL